MVIGGGASWVCLGSSGEAPSLPAALSSFQRRVRQLGDVGDLVMVLVLELFCCHCCSVTKLCPTFCDPVNCMQHGRHPCPSPSPGGFKFTSIELVMLSNQLILCHPLLLLPSIFPNIRIFSSELTVYIRWPKCWRFSFSINPSNEYSGLISLRID